MSDDRDTPQTTQSADAELRRRVVAIVADVLQIGIDHSAGNLLRSETTQWDSVNHLRLALEFEEVFGITISDEQWVSLNSVEEIIALLATHGGPAIEAGE